MVSFFFRLIFVAHVTIDIDVVNQINLANFDLLAMGFEPIADKVETLSLIVFHERLNRFFDAVAKESCARVRVASCIVFRRGIEFNIPIGRRATSIFRCDCNEIVFVEAHHRHQLYSSFKSFHFGSPPKIVLVLLY